MWWSGDRDRVLFYENLWPFFCCLIVCPQFGQVLAFLACRICNVLVCIGVVSSLAESHRSKKTITQRFCSTIGFSVLPVRFVAGRVVVRFRARRSSCVPRSIKVSFLPDRNHNLPCRCAFVATTRSGNGRRFAQKAPTDSAPTRFCPPTATCRSPPSPNASRERNHQIRPRRERAARRKFRSRQETATTAWPNMIFLERKRGRRPSFNNNKSFCLVFFERTVR